MTARPRSSISIWIKDMKKSLLIYALIACLILPTVVLVTSAHSGRTDGSGGHTKHSTGEYHYHHGYSAHDHYDIDGDGKKDCPYDFHDNAGTASSKTESTPLLGGIIAAGLYIFFMFILPFIISK